MKGHSENRDDMRMYTTPMNYDLACELKDICEQMTSVLNSLLSTKNEEVEAIAVAPYDMLNKWHFFNFYMATRNNGKALGFYKYSHYDVIAIIRHIHHDGEVSYTYRSVNAILKFSDRKMFYC